MADQEKKSNICKAMAAAFHEIETALKDKANPYFKSKYADLGSVISAIKPALAAHGLWYIQKVHPTPGYASVETIIMHEDGGSLSCGITSVPVGKVDAKTGAIVGVDAQGYGSALTYSRRYSLSSAFSVSAEDDDGNAACRRPAREEEDDYRSEEVPKLRSQEVPKPLTPSAITALAAQVADAFPGDVAVEVNEGDLFDFLTDWQKTMPLQPTINYLLQRDKNKLLDSFYRWNGKRAAKVRTA